MTKRHPSCVLLGFPLQIVCGKALDQPTAYSSPFPSLFDRISDCRRTSHRARTGNPTSGLSVALTEEHNFTSQVRPLVFVSPRHIPLQIALLLLARAGSNVYIM